MKICFSPSEISLRMAAGNMRWIMAALAQKYLSRPNTAAECCPAARCPTAAKCTSANAGRAAVCACRTAIADRSAVGTTGTPRCETARILGQSRVTQQQPQDLDSFAAREELEPGLLALAAAVVAHGGCELADQGENGDGFEGLSAVAQVGLSLPGTQVAG